MIPPAVTWLFTLSTPVPSAMIEQFVIVTSPSDAIPPTYASLASKLTVPVTWQLSIIVFSLHQPAIVPTCCSA